MLSKKDFYASLTREQLKYLDYLLDEYYLKGFEEGRTEAIAVSRYERY